MQHPSTIRTDLVDCSALSLELAATDSPFFRAKVALFQNELEAFGKWLDSVCRVLRQYTDEMIRTNEVQSTVIATLMPHSGLHLFERTITRIIGDALQSVYQVKAKLVDDIIEQLIEPFLAFLKEDVRDMKDVTRNFDRVLERYETAVTRYGNLSKTKESSALREDAFVLYEFRKQYIRASLELAHRVIIFRIRVHGMIMERLMNYISSHSEFYDTAAQVFKGLMPQLTGLKAKLDESIKVRNQSATKLETTRKILEDEAITKAKPLTIPSTTTSLSLDVQSGERGGTRHIPSPLIPSASTPTEKEGYLFKRVFSSKPLTVQTWARRWFRVKNGGFSYCMVSPKQRGVVLSTPALNVLLCSVRVVRNEDRRFSFEVSTVHKRNFILQAETEDDMNEWIATIEAAKYQAAGEGPASTPFIGDMATDIAGSDDEEDAIPLHEIKMSEGDIKPSTAENEGEEDDDDEDESDGDKEQGKPDSPADQSSGDDIGIRYSDRTLGKENTKLHRLLKSVPKNDYVLDAFSCAMQKDIAVHGRLYITYDRICFYSNILGFIRMLVTEMKDVLAVVQKKGPLSTTILVTTSEATHSFLLFYSKDEAHFTTLKAAWLNATNTEQRLSPQELYDSVSKRKHATAGVEIESEESDGRVLEAAPVADPTTGQPATASEYDPPSDLALPAAEVPCGCGADHQEKKEADVVFNVPAKKLFDVLFGNETTFWSQRFHPKRGESGRQNGIWSDGPEPQREVKYMMPVNNPMVKVKEAEVIATERLVKRNDYFIYVVEAQSSTPALPYADAFAPVTRYCITWVTKHSCRLVMTCGVKFFKSPMVKGMIRSAGMKGLAEGAADTVALLKQEIDEYNRKVLGKTPSSAESAGAEAIAISSPTPGDTTVNVTRRGATEELPFGLGSPIAVYTLVVLLLISCVCHLVGWWQGPSKGSVMNISPRTVDWVKDFNLGDNDDFTQSFKTFMTSHYHLSEGNSTISLRAPSSRRRLYYHPSHFTLQSQLAQVHSAVHEVLTDIRGMMEEVHEVERQVIWSMFMNWIGDKTALCQNEGGSHCNGVATLVKEVEIGQRGG
ncbi:uncharacterized protein SPPG_05963 [Spizellomyces punctatus DAOM BR117]|uniref:Uncharacterized protein n=1 Tax=Spizellomyces punctatus (strain DAOM BR117) TaxID=645134 RepID=A0A0L0HE23_SPIPD|nr:uncharacterized protein SPPG_05963 [Spizellomyces punctatus DAOM BR117]KNC99013.1 hypothetical protein SPPG_05963 [Spizellomyces punctatus DAOM BR117]|eukprot:XP_016607053.1 hypothetical protein SPPG_05963 [Spizellomyces punctatus DAOM BR117]